MSRPKIAPIPTGLWCWRRRIARDRLADWTQRLEDAGIASWATTEKPESVRLLLAVYLPTRTAAHRLQLQFGGGVRRLAAAEWLTSGPTPPLRIGKALEIVRDPVDRHAPAQPPRLHLPHGLAFGSGEHATTAMLLRALARRTGLSQSAVLDLGTGSGILALAARRFGAVKITATDWDAEAVRTASDNEALNFGEPLIRWRRADVKRLRARGRYGLVLANLFSGILGEAAAPIAAAVSAGGELWLSGILRAQEADVTAAYRRQGLDLVRAARRGKWVMLRFRRSGPLTKPAAR